MTRSRRDTVGGWRSARGACVLFLFLLPTTGLAVLSPPLLAHHSLAGMYDTSKRVTVDGSIAEFHFVNPHPFILVDVTDTRGRAERWHLEMDNRRELADIGMKEDTFKVGDRVVASGSPGRSQSRILYVWKLDRPTDGLAYEQIGASPKIHIPRPQ